MRLGLTFAESCAHRTRIGPGRPVQFRYGTGEARFGHVTESTSFIAIHRQLLVIQHQFAEQLDLLDLVVWWRSQPLERLCLDTVDLGLDLRNFRQCLGRERYAGPCAPSISEHSVTKSVTATVIEAFIRLNVIIGYPSVTPERQSVCSRAGRASNPEGGRSCRSRHHWSAFYARTAWPALAVLSRLSRPCFDHPTSWLAWRTPGGSAAQSARLGRRLVGTLCAQKLFSENVLAWTKY